MQMFCFPLSKWQFISFVAEKEKSSTAIKTQTAELEKMINCSPLPRLVEIKVIFLDEVELEE